MTMPSGLRPSNNPFLSPPVLPDAPDAEHLEAARTDKPWGHETLFADGSHGYVGKLIHVLAGRSLSLQLHHRKDETISVISGEMVFEAGPSAGLLERTTMLAGDTVHVPATVVHRITAVTDKGIAHLASLAQLTDLRLDSVTLTDAGVRPLESLGRLKVLNLYHTLVTDKGFEQLKAALPGCKIIWDRESALPIRRGS